MKTKVYVLGEVFTNYEYAPLCHESDDTVIIAVDATGKNEWAAEVYFWSNFFDDYTPNFDNIKCVVEECFEEIYETWSALFMAYEDSGIKGIDKLYELYSIKEKILENVKVYGFPVGWDRQVWHINEDDLKVSFVNLGYCWHLICRIR